MANKFDLDNFFKHYQPKNYVDNIIPYLAILPEYKYFNTKKDYLEPGHYYIRYVPVGQSNMDTDYKSHIRTGGVLVGYGKNIHGDIVRVTADWDYLILYRRSRKQQYYIKATHNFIFYKPIVNRGEKMSQFMNSIKVILHKDEPLTIQDITDIANRIKK